jgi:hypothetical protein
MQYQLLQNSQNQMLRVRLNIDFKIQTTGLFQDISLKQMQQGMGIVYIHTDYNYKTLEDTRL